MTQNTTWTEEFDKFCSIRLKEVGVGAFSDLKWMVETLAQSEYERGVVEGRERELNVLKAHLDQQMGFHSTVSLESIYRYIEESLRSLLK